VAVPASVARGLWLKLADDCMAKMELFADDADPTINKNGPTFAAMGQAAGEYYGWTDPRLQGWFDTACAVRSPAGGYGVGRVEDGLPADTDWLITTAGFVAPRLAAGYDHGLVSQADFDVLLDRVRNWPVYAYNWNISGQPGALPDDSSTATGGTTGRHTADRIWNMIAVAATFLLYNRNKTDSVRSADCTTKGAAWKNAIVWAMNRPANFGGWGYRGVTATTRADGSHNWECATMSAWLPGGITPFMTQMAAGITPGDIGATTSGTPEGCYVSGAMALMAQHPEACGLPLSNPYSQPAFADQLIGRVMAGIDAGAASTNPGGWASQAFNCLMVHRNGMTL